MSVLSILIYRFSAIPNKILASYFVDVSKPILKFIWRGKRFRIASIILKQNKVGGLTVPKFKTYCKSYSNQGSVVLYLWKKRQNAGLVRELFDQPSRSMEQNRELRKTHINICQLIFDQKAKTIQWSKDSILFYPPQEMIAEQLVVHMQKKKKKRHRS